ncbi:MAG TPA: alpha-glucan family phosphorylase [Thermotogota bacterium]|nr:alpha-glucan family phosphorylase [Thermotogota bacterium]
MGSFKTISVVPNIPERIARLRDLAYSFWNAWNPDVESLFSNMNKRLWTQVTHNPVKFLKHVSQRRLDQAAGNPEFLEVYDRLVEEFDRYTKNTETWFVQNCPSHKEKDFCIAYFSAEFGLHESFPIYSGGLGILAGDHVKSSSDLGIPLVGLGLLYRNGYFQQHINKDGWQEAYYPSYTFNDFPLVPIKNDFGEELRVVVELPSGNLQARVWKATVMNTTLLLLDTDIPENPPEFRGITAQLYGGDQEMRIKQEILLGIGGVRALRMAGYSPSVWHMNEGHSVFMALERIRELVEGKGLSFPQALELVRSGTVFTTHTPVPAGNDAFHYSLMEKYFNSFWSRLKISKKEFLQLGTPYNGENQQLFNLTILAMKVTAWRNGVSKLHGEVSRGLWKDAWVGVPEQEIPITHVTNGVHAETWLHPEMRSLFDRFLPDWKQNLLNKEYWAKLDEVPDEELWKTTRQMKKQMIQFVHKSIADQRARHGETIEQLREIDSILDADTLTIGFARRFATYKRATLIFRNLDRLRSIINHPEKPVQFLFAGKAHPADRPGQELIRRVYEISRYPEFKDNIVLLENYNMEVARYLVSGVDIWLNTPRRPHEASGTSGEKVPLNGGINFSVLDGWWVEGYDGHNGWIIGDGREYSDSNIQDTVDAVSFYDTLEKEIVSRYYDHDENGIPRSFLKIMRQSIKSVVPQFNTHRMLRDYLERLYTPAYTFRKSLREDDFRKAKELSEWKEKIRGEWDAVKVHSSTVRKDGEEIPVSLEVEFSSTVYLGNIDPEDVSVELYFARYNIYNEMEGFETFPMELEQQTLHNTYVFRGTAKLSERGDYRYSIRVVPRHPLLPHPHDMGLCKWLDE